MLDLRAPGSLDYSLLAALPRLRGLRRLSALTVQEPEAQGPLIESLVAADLPELTHLSVSIHRPTSDFDVSADTWAAFQQAPPPASLLTALARLSRLQRLYLSLSGVPLDGSVQATLLRLPLRALSLDGVGPGDDAVRQLADFLPRLTGLRRLRMNAVDTLVDLSPCSSLRWLRLTETYCALDIRLLRLPPTVTCLVIRACKGPADALPGFFSQLPALALGPFSLLGGPLPGVFDIDMSGVSLAEEAALLNGLRLLRHLVVGGSSLVHFAGATAPVAARLTELFLVNLDRKSHVGVLSTFTSLTRLCATAGREGYVFLEPVFFYTLSLLPRLRSLELPRPPSAAAAALGGLLGTGLRALSLQVSSDGMAAADCSALARFSGLEFLELRRTRDLLTLPLLPSVTCLRLPWFGKDGLDEENGRLLAAAARSLPALQELTHQTRRESAYGALRAAFPDVNIRHVRDTYGPFAAADKVY